MADIRRDWLTNQNTDWCFVVIGLVGRQSHSRLLQLKIDPVRQMGPPYWLAPSRCQRIYINIRGQYGIQKNIYIHRWQQQQLVQLHRMRTEHSKWFSVTFLVRFKLRTFQDIFQIFPKPFNPLDNMEQVTMKGPHGPTLKN